MAEGIRPDPVFDGNEVWFWSTEDRARQWAREVTYDNADVWKIDLDGVTHEHATHIDDADDAEDVEVAGGVGADHVTLIDTI